MSIATIATPVRPTIANTTRDPLDAGDNHVAAEALNAVALFLRDRDPHGRAMLGREHVTPTELESAAVLAEVGALPEGLTVFASSEHHRRVLARTVRAADLGVWSVGAPGGMKLVIYVQK